MKVIYLQVQFITQNQNSNSLVKFSIWINVHWSNTIVKVYHYLSLTCHKKRNLFLRANFKLGIQTFKQHCFFLTGIEPDGIPISAILQEPLITRSNSSTVSPPVKPNQREIEEAADNQLELLNTSDKTQEDTSKFYRFILFSVMLTAQLWRQCCYRNTPKDKILLVWKPCG